MADHGADMLPRCHCIITLHDDAINIGEFHEGTPLWDTTHEVL